MKVAVLGGAGFVGSAFVRHCENRRIPCDCIDLDNYREFSGGCYDLVINAAGESRKYQVNRDPAGDLAYSLEPLLRSFGDFSFSGYVYISSVDVYPDHEDPELSREEVEIDLRRISHYGFHKYLGERMVIHYCPRFLIIRLGGVLGPGLRKNPVYDLIHNLPLRVDEASEYQYLTTDFLAGVVFNLAGTESWNEIFNVCGTGTVSLAEVRNWLGRDLSYAGEARSRERYEISNEKISRLFPVPDSRKTVREFIAGVQ